ncbi:MAG: SLC13/DASS family transporter [Acidobacteria bacterium]|nr:SLC13/DASS family transporter [Acidobacteriota bacterium]
MSEHSVSEEKRVGESAPVPAAVAVRNSRQKIGLVLGLVLFFLTLALPGPEGMSPPAQRLAAVVLLMATWWVTEAVNIALTSLLPLALFPVLGIMSSSSVAPFYADHTIYLFFGGFMVALAIQKWHLHKRIALHTIRWVGTQPARLLLGFMISTAFLSMWMSNTACTLMMYPIGMAVVLQLAGEKDSGRPVSARVLDSFGSVLMLGIAFAASLGGIATLIGTPPNLVFAGAVTRLFPDAPEIGFLQWMGIGVPLLVVYLPIMWLYLCRFGARQPLREVRFEGTQTVIQDELNKLGGWTRPEKYVLAVWSAMAFLWIFRAPIRLGTVTVPGWSNLFGTPAFIADTTVSMTMGLVLCLLPIRLDNGAASHERVFLLDWETLRAGVPWGILLLFGGGFALAAGFEQTGLSEWVGRLLGAMAGMPPVVMVMLTCIILMVLTEVTSNTAVAIMAMPILAAAAVQMGVHPYVMMISGTIAASCAFMLPVATPPNAIIFASGWVTIPQMARVGIMLDILGVFLITALIFLLGGPLLGISFTEMPNWAVR